MAASRSTSQPAEVVSTNAEPTDDAAAIADPALAAPDSDTEVIAPATATETGGQPVVVAGPGDLVEPAEGEAPNEALEPAAVAPPVVTAPAVAQQVVYVEAPKPFVKKGNRGFGVIIAVLSTVIFAALYAVALVIDEVVTGLPASFDFISNSDATNFWPPVVIFLVAFVILVLILNRAGWAAHVLGSLFVGIVVYFGGTGAILLLHASDIPSNQVGLEFKRVLLSAALIIAALLAREVSLWMGFAVAARGRRVKSRNVDARVLYDQEIATKRAEYERANAATRVPESAADDVTDETVAP